MNENPVHAVSHTVRTMYIPRSICKNRACRAKQWSNIMFVFVCMRGLVGVLRDHLIAQRENVVLALWRHCFAEWKKKRKTRAVAAAAAAPNGGSPIHSGGSNCHYIHAHTLIGSATCKTELRSATSWIVTQSLLSWTSLYHRSSYTVIWVAAQPVCTGQPSAIARNKYVYYNRVLYIYRIEEEKYFKHFHHLI